jgi:hypothetical protein
MTAICVSNCCIWTESWALEVEELARAYGVDGDNDDDDEVDRDELDEEDDDADDEA